jgi:hypothetical protein
MDYKKFLPAFCLFLVSGLYVFAQRDTLSLQTIIDRSIKYTNSYPIEKVYLHFDKPYYAAGDTIWFKAYATTDIHLPSQLSKVVYVDVYNDQDSMMTSIKLPLVNGVAPGMIPLPPQSYAQGNYRLRAYTMWMLNFDPAYLFTKILTIGNPIDNDVQTNVSFINGSGAQPALNVKILYKDGSGKPYADKKVSWRVEAVHEVTSKGRGNTDANGYLTISLPPTPSITLSTSTLFTSLDNGTKSINSTFPLKSAAPGKDVQFFPEGGQLIEGVPGKVAFKAIKADGLGIDIKGTITDNQGQTVTNFTSSHLGMGIFALSPEAGKVYKANITFADGSQASYDLPRVQASGITLAVAKNTADSLTIRIVASQQYFQANQGKNYYIVAQAGGFIRYAAQTKLQQQLYSATIPKTKFQSGTLQITLFGPNGYPVSERVVFIQKKDLLNLTATTDKPLYNHRQPVKLTINAKNGTLPAEANLSVAVIDESKVRTDEDAESTILSALLLTSDLKGYIEKPNYYFNRPDEKTAVDLDVLMLTQGYRRFVFRDVLMGRNTPKITLAPEQGITVTGTLRNRTGLPIFKGNVRLLVPDKNFSAMATTNADGQFKFDNVMIYDSTKVVVNARDNLNYNNLMVIVDGTGYPSASRITNLPDEKLNIDTAMRPYLENSKRVYTNSHQLKEVVIKSAPPPKRLGHLDHPALIGLSMEPDHLIDGERFKGCTFFISCLQTMALGLTYLNNTFYVTRDYNAGIKKPVAVFMDGLSVDMNYLQSVTAEEVESVEIFLKDGVSGINQRDGTDGVLVINKKKIPKSNLKLSDLQALLPPPYLVNVTPRGYTQVKEFYSPKYDVTKPSTVGVDLRSTIYWNPKVTTDKITGNTILQYNNADGTGSYRAVVEGIDKDGNIGRYVYRYKVQ